MAFFKSAFSRFSPKSASGPIVATNKDLDTYCHQFHAQAIRLVERVEMCTASCAGEDAWGTSVGVNHRHTLIRVSLASTTTDSAALENTLLIERVLSTDGASHSVTPIPEVFPTGGTLVHPEVHDRLCAIYQGSSTKLARDLVVERTLTFGNRALTLAQLARILAFVSQTTKMVGDGGDCQFQSRSFAFTCLVAMAPSIPPPKAGVGFDSIAGSGSDLMEDSVFELTAEAFLAQMSRMVRDPVSTDTLELIRALKAEPHGRTRTRLYH